MWIATTTAWLLAGVVSIPPPHGLEQKLVDDAKDGKLDTMSLLEAALTASGVPDDEVHAEAERTKAALAPSIALAKAEHDEHKRGEVLLRALHGSVFRSYAMTASEIDDVIHTGRYNCLSSALLYVVAAEGLLDEPKAMVTKHHAFARVKVNGKAVDVETTSPNGFDADRAKLMTPDYVKKIAGADTTPEAMLADLRSPEELPVLSLVAGVYSNRAVGLVHRGDLEAAAVALDRAQHIAAGNLRTRLAAWRGGVLNQGAIELVDANRLDDARALLELALDGTDGETRTLLSQNLAAVHLKIADAALSAHDWTGALSHVDTAAKLGALAKDTGPIKARADAALAAAEGNDSRCASTKNPRDAAECFAGIAYSVREKDPDRALQSARRAFSLDARAPNSERALFYSLVKKAKVEADALHCDAVETLVREASQHSAALDGQHWSADESAGNCWAHAGDAAFDHKDWADAGQDYERARAHLANDPHLQQNLAAVDVNHAIEVAGKGDCDQARALSMRARRADPSLANKATQVLESCASIRAKKFADAGDWAQATNELRRGLLDAPKSPVLEENLGTMLNNLAADAMKKHDCKEARALLPELERYGKTKARDVVVHNCP